MDRTLLLLLAGAASALGKDGECWAGRGGAAGSEVAALSDESVLGARVGLQPLRGAPAAWSGRRGPAGQRVQR